MTEIVNDILRGVHPVAIMHQHQITAGILQIYLLSASGQPYPEYGYPMATGTVRYWAPRFRALGHMGLEGVP